MKININTEFVGKDIKNTKSCEMYMTIIDELQKNNMLSIENEDIKKEYPNIKFPDEKDLNVIFRKKDKNYTDSLCVDENASGVFILSDSDSYLDSFNIVVFIDDDQMNSFIDHEHFLDVESGSSYPGSKEFHVISYLNTLTHEIEHAIEFMGNSGGLTPLEVHDLNLDNKFDYGVSSCSSGYGFFKYEEDFKEIDEIALKEDLDMLDIAPDIYQIVEDRVESNSRKKLESLDVNFIQMYEKPSIKKKLSNDSLSP